MSIEFIDGFEQDVNFFSEKWDVTSSNAAAGGAGRFGGLCASYQNQPLILTSNQLSAQQTRTVGFAWKFQASSNNNPFFLFQDSGTTQVDLRLTATNQLQVTRAGTNLGNSGSNIIPTNTWIYIEFQATISATVGAVIVKVWSGPSPGTWISLSGINTQNTGNASMNGLSFPNAGYGMQCDDFYCLNPNGTVNNTFLGESQIFTTLPTGDDASFKQWTPSAGTNHYANVSDQPQDGDTTYNGSQTVGNIDLFTFPSISPTGPIICCQSVLTVRKDATGTRSVQEQCKSGATVFNGTNIFPLGSSYGMFREIRENDPNTTAQWTVANLNAAEFGIKLVA